MPTPVDTIHVDANPTVGWAKQVRPAMAAGAIRAGTPQRQCWRDQARHLLRPYKIDGNDDINDTDVGIDAAALCSLFFVLCSLLG